MSGQRDRSRAVLLSVAVTVLAFGLAPFLKKAAIADGVAPASTALVTAVTAAVGAMAIMAWHQPRALVCLVDRRYFGPLLLVGMVAGAAVTLLVAFALSSTTATNRSLFQAAYPAATLVFAHGLLGERLRVAQYLAILLLMAGIVLMNDADGGVRFGTGFWLLLGTLPLIGLTDVYSKRLTTVLSPLVLAGGRHIYGALFVIAAAPLLTLGDVTSPANWLRLGAAGLLQAVGVWTLYRAFELSKASLVSSLVAAAPLVTLVAETVFLGLVLNPGQWSGVALVIGAAVWLALGGTREREPR